jgi:hypothetical protein
MIRPLLLALLALLTAGSLAAQDRVLVPIEVRVTAVAGDAVYLDAGRDSRVEVGDRVRLFPLGGASVEGQVRSVARRSSRAQLSGVVPPLEIGTPGEILLPAARVRPAPPTPAVEPATPGAEPPADEPQPPEPSAPQPEAPPEHPPWTRAPEEWDESTPLLAPVSSRGPEDRETRWKGRAFLDLDQTWDTESGASYSLLRGGVDVRWENPFERGGEVELDGDLVHHGASFDDGPDESETDFRPDRLSYRVGGVRGRPDRWEVGRFLHSEFPEFGLVDGVEHVKRFDSGSRFGWSVGFLPVPDESLQTGEDAAVTVFYRWVDGEEEDLALGAGYQKSWHDGSADRDLFVGTLDWRPGLRTNVFGTAWIDYYTSGDEIKGSGPELTQLLLNLSHRFEAKAGLSVFASHFKYPELLRDEFDELTAQELADNAVSRVGVSGWRQLTERVRLNGRVDSWSDEDGSGGSADVRVDLRDLLYDRGTVSLGVFTTDGQFSSGNGLRLSATRRLEDGFLRATWDATDYEQAGFLGDQRSLLHHVLRVNWDKSIGRKLDLSLYVEDRFGDEQGSLAVGVLLQRRL